MAEYNINEKYTLFDRLKASVVGPIIAVMNAMIEDFFKDIPFVECNQGLVHKFRRDTGMADSTNRGFYQGVGSTKRNTQIVSEEVMLKERRREIDEDEIDTMDLAKGKEELRRQDEGHIQKLGEDVVDAFFNGGVTDGSENVRGIRARLASLNPAGLNNVMSCGHTAVGSSIYVVEWNPGAGAYGLYPPGYMKNTTYGISARDKGKEKCYDVNDATASYYAYVAQFKAWLGLAIGDNLKIARLGNINPDIDGANNFISGNGQRKLIQLLNNGHFDRSRTRIYCNPDIKSQIDTLGVEKSNLQLVDVFGKPVKAFQEIPIRQIDRAILPSTEAVVA